MLEIEKLRGIPTFRHLYEGVNERLSLVCKGSGGTFYFNKQLKETLLESDENLKVRDVILTEIKRKSRERRATDRNSQENVEENPDGYNI
uniref:Uncharacterized protein n=1 Tax=Strongyloides venezuelensis TaxID=75913 RepID=A0A0K0FRX5_STRVS